MVYVGVKIAYGIVKIHISYNLCSLSLTANFLFVTFCAYYALTGFTYKNTLLHHNNI